MEVCTGKAGTFIYLYSETNQVRLLKDGSVLATMSASSRIVLAGSCGSE